MRAWHGFQGESWKKKINLRDFIQENYTPYDGESAFLEGPTTASHQLMAQLETLFLQESEKGILSAETRMASRIDGYGAGYLDPNLEKIVGLQTDAPLKRAIFPKTGIKMVQQALTAYGYTLDPVTLAFFEQDRKTHNEGVFSAYTDDIRACRRSGVITGLPDAYGRGRIIGDYRRVALYGVDFLVQERINQLKMASTEDLTEERIRNREEWSDQIKALKALITMAAAYGYDVTGPAETAQEAVQWTYFAYLAAAKDQNGAATSLGRVSTFLDIYLERDLKNGRISEQEAQELIDHLVMKLRMVRFLRTPEYNDLFAGDPTWVTESLGGIGVDGRSMVTKTSYRFLNTLYNLGAAPEPNLTVLWSDRLPEGWKQFCAETSIKTSSIQYVNDELLRPLYGDDYGIACCVSPMKIGKQMQFFGARMNLPKALLYAINGGKDERTGEQVAPCFEPITTDYLAYEPLLERFDQMLEWLAGVYVKALNIIHYMHDKYAYESFQMALHDPEILRTQAFGIAGLSIVADSLAAVKQAKVKIIRNEQGLAVDYTRTGDYVPFGNHYGPTDEIAADLVKRFMNKLRKHATYRHAVPTQSILTITSNVVYGKKTGSTPCGRQAGAPFSPGANPMHERDQKGALASLLSVASLPFDHAADGISYTFAVTPAALGKLRQERAANLVQLLEGYFRKNSGQHLNVNVLDRVLLEAAMRSPEKYAQLTIRVSGYAVNFVKLTPAQQAEVLRRTINERL